MRLGVFLLLLASCSLSGPIRIDRSAQGYFFPEPLAGWVKQVPQEGAEIVYEHSASHAILSVSSVCERYEESNLKTLARAAVAPIENNIEKEIKTFMLDGREALELYISGKVNGVAVEVDFVSWRKADCLFDFSVQGAGTLPAKVREDFLSMVKKFRYKP